PSPPENPDAAIPAAATRGAHARRAGTADACSAPRTPASSVASSTALHGADEDHRLQQLVLELLVEDEEDDRRYPGGYEARERRDARHDGAEGRADQRDETGEGDERGDQPGEPNNADLEHAADDADEQVAGDVGVNSPDEDCGLSRHAHHLRQTTSGAIPGL